MIPCGAGEGFFECVPTKRGRGLEMCTRKAERGWKDDPPRSAGGDWKVILTPNKALGGGWRVFPREVEKGLEGQSSPKPIKYCGEGLILSYQRILRLHVRRLYRQLVLS